MKHFSKLSISLYLICIHLFSYSAIFKLPPLSIPRVPSDKEVVAYIGNQYMQQAFGMERTHNNRLPKTNIVAHQFIRSCSPETVSNSRSIIFKKIENLRRTATDTNLMVQGHATNPKHWPHVPFVASTNRCRCKRTS